MEILKVLKSFGLDNNNKINMLQTQELNEKCSFLNEESVIHIKCRHTIRYFAISQSKVLYFYLMSSITSGH